MTGPVNASAADPTSLLPPNATALERAFEALTRRLDDIPVPLRDLVNVETCPDRFLPWLAFTRSVDSWNPAWSSRVKRNLIAASIDLHRRKGSAASVRAVVQAFGGQIALREWWQMVPRGEPYTFDMVLTLTGNDGEMATQSFIDEVIDEVARTKPVRAWFTVTQGFAASGDLALSAAARPAIYRRLQLSEAA